MARVNLRSTRPDDWPYARYEAECPICGTVYYELTKDYPNTHEVQGGEETIEEGDGCRHLVDVEGETVTFSRWPSLFALRLSLFARYRRSRLRRSLARWCRKLLK